MDRQNRLQDRFQGPQVAPQLVTSRGPAWFVVAFSGLAVLLLAGLGACRSAPAKAEANPGPNYSVSGHLLLQGDELLRTEDLAGAVRAYQRSVDAAVRERNNSNLVEALAQLADIGRRRGDGSGEQWLFDAQDRAQADEPLGWSRLLLVEGLFAQHEGRTGAAQSTFRDLFEYCEEHELYDRAMDAAHRLSLTGTLEQRTEWSENGIRLAEDLSDEHWQAVLWNNLGWTYNDAQLPEEALDAFLRARDLRLESGSDETRLAADYSVARAYRILGDVESALEWIGPAHRMAEERYRHESSPANARWLGLTQLELAEVAADLGAGRETVSSLQRAYSLLLESGAREWWPAGLERIQERLAALLPKGRS